MSEELNRKQYQPFHGLRYMEASFGKGGVPAYEFFEHVFNMNKEEVDKLVEDVRKPSTASAVEALAKSAEESIMKRALDIVLSEKT